MITLLTIDLIDDIPVNKHTFQFMNKSAKIYLNEMTRQFLVDQRSMVCKNFLQTMYNECNVREITFNEAQKMP
jgi:hypothetical protein